MMTLDRRGEFRGELRTRAYFYGGPLSEVREECEELVRILREKEEKESKYVKTPLEPGTYYFDGTGFTSHLVDEAPEEDPCVCEGDMKCFYHAKHDTEVSDHEGTCLNPRCQICQGGDR